MESANPEEPGDGELARLRRHLRALSAVNRQLHAQLESGVPRGTAAPRDDLLATIDGVEPRFGPLKVRRSSAGAGLVEQLQLRGGAKDPFLVRSERGAFVIEGPLRREVKAGLLFAALARILPQREVSESDLDHLEEGAPVEVLEGPAGPAFIVVGGRRLPLRGLPLPHAVSADAVLSFPEGAELRVSGQTAPRPGRAGRARAVIQEQGPVQGSATLFGWAVRRLGSKPKSG